MNLAHVSKLNFLISLIGASASYGCSAGAGTSSDDAGDGDRGGDDSAGGGDLCVDCDGGGIDGIDDPLKNAEAPPNCGDGVLNEDEACDDGNRDPDDGCYANCLGTDPGFICPQAGQPCFEFAVCGDGLSKFPEQCDDGNTVAGDGCSDNCKIEIGYKCDTDGVPCAPTTCGDGVVEGAEMCETGDAGCTGQCQFAPDCSGDGGACTSSCGDGLVLGEACDDGNTLSGDGCSADCQQEEGYTCTNQSTAGDCERSATTGECILRIPVIYRDFAQNHPDFTTGGAPTFNHTCTNMDAGDGVSTGIVNTSLAGGKPTLATDKECSANLGEWYVDGPSSETYPSEIVLYQETEGGSYVNRWGANGEKFNWVGWSEQDGITCTGMGDCPYDGTPFFYPLENMPNPKDNVRFAAAVYDGVAGQYGGLTLGTKTEAELTGVSTQRNYAFTSEIAYWFTYDESTNATLAFTGDDDVWVFVNGQLALDLGGRHPAQGGEFTISGASGTLSGGTNASHNMTPGNVYEIKIFHAERGPNGSTFKLTLAGFDTSRSDCRATCGDGIVAFGEQCDEGENNGAGYNQCGTDCRLGSYCGDGIVDEGEVCDDADTSENATSNCVNCRIPIVR